MAPTLCRNKRHPVADRRRNGAGHTQCGGCLTERLSARHELAPGGRDGWTDPQADAERQSAYTEWAAGVDDAIRRLRREEGFNGRKQTWQTLGDVVGMQATPPPPRPDPRLRIVNCGRCGTPRFASARCATCALASARFQRLAAPDAGARFGPTGRELIRGH